MTTTLATLMPLMADTMATCSMLSSLTTDEQPKASPATTRMRTVYALLEGYSSLSVPQLLRPLSPNFTHRVLPSSLGMPARDRASFSEHAKGIFNIFDSFRMIPDAIYEDEVQGVVVIHARMEGILRQTKGSWKNECVMIVTLSRDNHEVVEIREFVDSAQAKEMKARHAPKEFGDEGKKKERRLSW